MAFWKRFLLALTILVVDSAVFFIPLTAVVIVFVILARPKWFASLMSKIYSY